MASAGLPSTPPPDRLESAQPGRPDAARAPAGARNRAGVSPARPPAPARTRRCIAPPRTRKHDCPIRSWGYIRLAFGAVGTAGCAQTMLGLYKTAFAYAARTAGISNRPRFVGCLPDY